MTEHDVESVAWCQVVAAVVLVLSPLPWASWIAAKDAPAWVQAVGSVAAIVATWALTTRAHRIDADRKREADLEFYRSVLKSTVRFFQSTADIPRFRENPSFPAIATWISGAIETMRRLDKIEALPVSSWPAPYIGVEFDAYMQRARYLLERAVAVRNLYGRNEIDHVAEFEVFAAWQSYMRQHREFLDLMRPYLSVAEIMEYRRWEDGSIQ